MEDENVKFYKSFSSFCGLRKRINYIWNRSPPLSPVLMQENPNWKKCVYSENWKNGETERDI